MSVARRRNSPRRQPGRARRIVVRDPERLQQLLHEETGGSAEADFARATGLSQATISRLLERGEPAHVISPATYRKLLRALRRRFDAFSGIFEGAEVQSVYRVYEERLRLDEESDEAELGLSSEARGVIRDLILQRPALLRAFRHFNAVAESRTVSWRRRVASLRWIFAPLLREFTWEGMEVGIPDLSKDDLANFILWGLKRETLLLERRGDDVSQAHRASLERRERVARRRDYQRGGIDALWSWDPLEAERLQVTWRNLAPPW